MAIMSITSKYVFIVWIFVFILSAIAQLGRGINQSKLVVLLSMLCYVSSCELWARMVDANPFVPYEIGKYLAIFVSLYGLFVLKVRIDRTGLLMFLLLFPALLFDLSGKRIFPNIVFNFFAPLGMALLIMTYSKVRVTYQDLYKFLWLIWLGSLSALVYAFANTPDLSSITFSLGANFIATGGEASNQVSTILGLGGFLSLYSWFYRLKFSGYRLLDLGVGIFFFFQGLITFSRGGLIVAVIGIAIVFAFSQLSQISGRFKKIKLKISPIYIVSGVILLAILFSQVDKITGGQLFLRYLGETEGTVLGRKEKNINVLTTNRYEIFMDDLRLWVDYPIFGVGAGSSKYLRGDKIFEPHIEVSRLLAEHGFLGLVFSLLWISLGFLVFKKQKGVYRGLMLALFAMAFLTSFHAAMRTYMTPLLTLLSLLGISYHGKIHSNAIVGDS